MRIVVASTYVPFLSGGGIKPPQDLATALRRAGHLVETVMIPMYSAWPRIAEQTVAIRLLNLTESCGDRIDRLITLRTPAYALSHPAKVVWFLHHHRAACDFWGTPFGDMPDSPEGRAARDMMVRSDTLYLREARRIYTQSRTVADRIRKFNGLEPDGVLYPPLRSDHLFRPGPFGDYFIYASRFNPHKRQDLAIRAMRYVRSGCRLVLTGAPDVPGFDRKLMELAHQLGVADRVEFAGWLSDEQHAELHAGCRAALAMPYDEDYGYVTLEPLHAGKPVIICSDGGAGLELIEDGHNGLVVAPEPQAIAEAMDRLWADRAAAVAMGRQALRTPEALGITWDHVVEQLTA
jgi:glycosyltransferase involved in cell wall biosynthesis